MLVLKWLQQFVKLVQFRIFRKRSLGNGLKLASQESPRLNEPRRMYRWISLSVLSLQLADD
jgi:hypothetical protein